MKHLLPIVTVMLILVGCASTTANLERESARAIGGITSSEVSVFDVRRGMSDLSWSVQSPRGRYQCQADDMLRRVNCVKAETP